MKTRTIRRTFALGWMLPAILGGADHPDAPEKPAKETAGMEFAMFGSGCFWCSEAVFESVDGVTDVVAGYAGGMVERPTYKQVCAGTTGHAEVVRIEFDPRRVSYQKLAALFWKIHDPTSLNRQGADVGTQYRSVIFTFSDEQKKTAEASRAVAQRELSKPIMTEILPAPVFYEAEPEHQDYYRRNPEAGYCRLVIRPKLRSLEGKLP